MSVAEKKTLQDVALSSLAKQPKPGLFVDAKFLTERFTVYNLFLESDSHKRGKIYGDIIKEYNDKYPPEPGKQKKTVKQLQEWVKSRKKYQKKQLSQNNR